MLTFNYAHRPYTLHHTGDCGFIGITPGKHLYIEEFYGDDRLAQHHLDENGHILASVDEGTDEDFTLLPLPENLIRPAAIKASLPLNYVGARHRGLREPERLSDMAQPVAVAEKIMLHQILKLENISLMMLAGIAESRVLSEAPLNDAGLFMVCRRILLAMMLPERRIDADGQPYDYETIPLHLIHPYDASIDTAPSLHEALNQQFMTMQWKTLNRPLECMTHADTLYIADGGGSSAQNQIHVWPIRRE